MGRRGLGWRAGAMMIAAVGIASAQQPDTFKGRLSPVPVTAATAPSTVGSGSLTATLQDSRLAVQGTFEGLNSRATFARLHRARPGMRGPSVIDLNITKATSGTIDGALKLTAVDMTHLTNGWFYVQLHTENNPDGHLRGWLLKPR